MIDLGRAWRRALLGGVLAWGIGWARPSHADEGQWMPKQIPQLDHAQLRALGLRLQPDELWNPDDGGLMRAVVNLSGCSAGFVSPRGLIATNHHCAYAAIQANSTVEHDYLSDGFIAGPDSPELPAIGATVKVLESTEDVSEAIRAIANAQNDPVARARSVDRARSEMVSQCESQDPTLSCQVAEFYRGREYQLLRYREFRDIRIVYAPPSSVGNFGGEVDNWMWPRHAGDFTFLRVYVGPDGHPAPRADDNIPYAAPRYFEVGAQGVRPGDFVGVLGYPGNTKRYLPAIEVQRQLQQSLPATISLYGEWIDTLQRLGASDPTVKIKVAAKLRRLANRTKNAQGTIDGIRRNGLLEQRQREHQALRAWLKQGSDSAGTKVLDDLATLSQQREQSFERDFLLRSISSGAASLAIAVDLVRRAHQWAKPDLDRLAPFKERAAPQLWERQQRRLRNYDARVDQALLGSWLRRVESLAPNQRFTAVRVADVASILRATRLTDPTLVRSMFETPDLESLKASRDPLLRLAFELVEALERLEQDSDYRRGEMMRLGPRYFEMVKAIRNGPVYPDANATLRLSYASVTGYSAQDGLRALPQTVVAGQVAKHTSTDPFALPPALLQAAANAPQTRWADPELGDVPVNFLSNADTTGGNSGSPVIDGQGRWVGLNFDRVWENVAGDFGYSEARSRNIIVDIRYILWLLDKVAGAEAILDELGVTAPGDGAPGQISQQAKASTPPWKGRGRIGTPSTTPSLDASGDAPDTPAVGGSCACRHRSHNSGSTGWVVWFAALLGWGRRRRNTT